MCFQSNFSKTNLKSNNTAALCALTNINLLLKNKPCRTAYLLFKKIVNLIEQGEHLKGEGIQSIINVRASLNLGLSEVLKVAFPNTIPVVRPYITSSEIPHSE